MSKAQDVVEQMPRLGEQKDYDTINDFDVDLWRYQCPDCENHYITVRRFYGHNHEHVEYQDSGAWERDLHIHRFRCRGCGGTFDRPFDKKHDERRHVDLDKGRVTQ